MRSAYLEPKTAEIRAPLGGLVSAGTADLLREQDLSLLVNFHLDKGGLTRRRGRFLVGTCPEAVEAFAGAHLRTATRREVLIVAGNHIILFPELGLTPRGACSGIWPAQNVDVIGGGGRRGKLLQYKDYLFYADGFGSPSVYQPGAAQTIPWGFQGGALPAPTSATPVAGGALTLLQWYGVAFAYRDPVRKITTNHSARITFQLTGVLQKATVVIPVFAGYDSRFTELLIYRTLATADATQAGAESLHLERTIGSITGASFPLTTEASIADAELPGDAPYENAGPPPAMSYITLFKERIVGFQGSHVYFSESGLEEGGVWIFAPLSDVPVELDTGDDIAGLFELGALYVVKLARGVFRLQPSATEDGLVFTAEKIAGAQVGCASPFTVVLADNYAYWLDERGVHEFDGTNVRCISDSPTGDRAGIRDLFLEYRATGRLKEAFGELDRQPDKSYVRWWVPRTVTGVDGITYYTRDQIVFDLTHRTWHVERPAGEASTDRVTGLFELAAFQYRDTDNATWIYTVDEDGNVYRHRSDESGAEVFSDVGSDYVSEMRSRLYGDGMNWILPLGVDAEIERSLLDKKAGTLTVSIYKDGFSGVVQEQAFSLFDELDSASTSDAIAMNASRRLGKRFGYGLRHEGGEADLTIVGAAARFQWLDRALRGA